MVQIIDIIDYLIKRNNSEYTATTYGTRQKINIALMKKQKIKDIMRYKLAFYRTNPYSQVYYFLASK